MDGGGAASGWLRGRHQEGRGRSPTAGPLVGEVDDWRGVSVWSVNCKDCLMIRCGENEAEDEGGEGNGP